MNLLSRIKWRLVKHNQKIVNYYLTIKSIRKSMKHFLSKEEYNNLWKRISIGRDIWKCRWKYEANANEYFLFGFREKNQELRNSYVTDIIKDNTLLALIGGNVFFSELKDKYNFYKLTKKYFNRDVMAVGPSYKSELSLFKQFAMKHQDLFVKSNASSCGRGISLIRIHDEKDAENLYSKLIKSGDDYIIEEKVVQAPEMARWNQSSVNTVRIGSFRQKDNTIKIAYPFIRMGRAGSVVDNAGQGGVYASIDVESGRICTDGTDENGNKYLEHPDSHIKFHGWQVPDFEELKSLVIECHHCMPIAHKYIGFDFALTNKGWSLIEGNWGQFLCQQTSLGRGLKKEFFELLEIDQ